MRWDNDAGSVEMLYDTVMNSHFKKDHEIIETLFPSLKLSFLEIIAVSEAAMSGRAPHVFLL
jgi:hypothetical protein